VNQFTNYDSLDKLIVKYNKIASGLSKLPNDLTVNSKLVDLRDALAHGRAFMSIPKTISPLLLLKFSDPKKGKTTKVEFIDVMTTNWLDEKIKWTIKEKGKVIKASRLISSVKP